MEYLLKMLFFANIASNLKVESMHFAHRNCEYILGVIYLLCFPVWLWADNKVNTYHFKSISTSVNFPTNEVRKLFQDSQGYIWISTYNGLLRYDGYSIVVYKPDGVNHGRSIDSFVNMVAEDKENNLWIGTHNGLYVLHKETDEIGKNNQSFVTGKQCGEYSLCKQRGLMGGKQQRVVSQESRRTYFRL